MRTPHIANQQRGGQTTSSARLLADRNTQRALNNRIQIKTFRAYNRDRYDLLSFLANVRQKIKRVLKLRSRLTAVKWYLVARVQLVREDAAGNVHTVVPFFRSVVYQLLTPDELRNEHNLNEACQKIVASLEKYIHESSGWTVKTVENLQLHTIDYKPLSASAYIDLPTTLKLTRSILNIKNQDHRCFVYSVLAKLHPNVAVPDLASSYLEYEKELNLTGLTFPMTLAQIDKFERQNRKISVNVFGFEHSEIIPLRITKHTTRQKHVNLLFIKTQRLAHYCLIKNFHRFLSRTRKHNARKYFCYYCLNCFSRKRILQNHMTMCRAHGVQKVRLPEKGKEDCCVKFSDYLKTYHIPFVIYADFETIQRPILACDNNSKTSHTTTIKSLEVCSFGYKVVCFVDDKYTKPVKIYRGENAADEFIKALLEEQQHIQELLHKNEPMVMTASDKKHFAEATHCSLCDLRFESGEQIAKDHEHLNGKYRNAMHMTSNLIFKPPAYIPVIFHGLRNFDSHIICQS